MTNSQPFAATIDRLRDDFELAELLTLAQATEHVPRRGRKKCAASTLWRWSTGGEPRLRVVKVGGTAMTTVRWLKEFFAAKAAAADGEQQPTRTPRQRERAVAAAERELSEAGL